MAFFDIDFSGEVTNVRFVEGDQEVMSVDERVLSLSFLPTPNR